MTDLNSPTIQWLDKEIKRHQFWRNLWSVVYFSGAAITVICGALATASAGFMDSLPHGQLITAALAGLTTIFASLEKVLRLREKWDLHRNQQVSLEMIVLRAKSGLIDNAEILDRVENAAHAYSTELAELNTTDSNSSN